VSPSFKKEGELILGEGLRPSLTPLFVFWQGAEKSSLVVSPFGKGGLRGISRIKIPLNLPLQKGEGTT